MFKCARTLPLLMSLVLMPALAHADTIRPLAVAPSPVFKDLPGVVPEKSRVTNAEEADDGVRCQSGIGYVRNPAGLRREMFGRDFPTQVYRCESGGVTYTGTDMPPNRPWVPGINPYFLPED